MTHTASSVQIKLRFLAKLMGALSCVALLFLAPVGGAASEEIVQFSADMIQQIPNQASIPGKLYVSKGKIRMETGAGEQRRITIVNFTDRKNLHLNPSRKEYMEVSWPVQKADAPRSLVSKQPLPGDSDHPCASSQRLQCKVLHSNEKIGDRNTEKWEIVRVMPANNQTSRTMRSVVWVDRELGANVREERFIDGELKGASELRAIKEGTQPESLFQVPAGYQRIQLPLHSSGGAGDSVGGEK
uniref:DUF4412 domain-containing protein n=1 Tax=Candidatus Kentrum sp. DK TaxID=2126562 RepID=A0A450S139_9GAMM|nr:MAG: hypothetical protein BECKDK2373B_GA0170837_101050 [Candidatus Kentron sp. DK]VFJ63483.1 MAG: hypothetical protein BECKDK2373C_GA0170839_11084 [Candidatus Kentron sp. DK]